MRVIAGIAKGKKLKSPKGMTTRPMLDRVKEALFSILSYKIEGARVLDLFAGVGSLGIEALSRGAESVIFIEEFKLSANILKENLETTKLTDKAVLIEESVDFYLKRNYFKDLQFDLIFMDPPYRIDSVDLKNIFDNILTNRLIAPEGEIVYHHHPKQPPIEIDELEIISIRKYGNSSLSFYKKKSEV
ncbi:MAG: 16S rRNA (guanine(966)-N(2))-methyltransferase RsmD [Actinobacteria bacterium]|nr:16S rRNA (guanine(966)-N(2))-methyltransferase RsmD [Actinomycetota bacterium]